MHRGDAQRQPGREGGGGARHVRVGDSVLRAEPVIEGEHDRGGDDAGKGRGQGVRVRAPVSYLT